MPQKNTRLKIHFLRHATFILEIAGLRFLIDPMFGAKGTYSPVRWTSNNIRNPMTDLPIEQEQLRTMLTDIHAVLVTHTHNDHWDPMAQMLIPKTTTIVSQPEDEKAFRSQGFISVLPVTNYLYYKGIKVSRTPAQHGTGEIGAKMAPASGFLISHRETKVYIVGDTIWCHDVKEIIEKYQPNYIILNTGAAQFDIGDPITMTAGDVLEVCRISKASKIICIHMETINHCRLQRDELKAKIEDAGFKEKCIVPDDGWKDFL